MNDKNQNYTEILNKCKGKRLIIFVQDSPIDNQRALALAEPFLEKYEEKFVIKEKLLIGKLTEDFVILPLLSVREGEKGPKAEARRLKMGEPVFVRDYTSETPDEDQWSDINRPALVDAIAASVFTGSTVARLSTEADWERRILRIFDN